MLERIRAFFGKAVNMFGSDDNGDWTDVLIAFVVAVVLYAVLGWFTAHYNAGKDTPLLVLAIILGAAAGWVGGILISPYNADEKAAFGELSKLVYGFATGWAVTKIDPMVNQMLGLSKDSHLSIRWLVLIAVALVSFMTAVAFTYVSRSYWGDQKRAAKEEAAATAAAAAAKDQAAAAAGVK